MSFFVLLLSTNLQSKQAPTAEVMEVHLAYELFRVVTAWAQGVVLADDSARRIQFQVAGNTLLRWLAAVAAAAAAAAEIAVAAVVEIATAVVVEKPVLIMPLEHEKAWEVEVASW